MIGIFDSGYGGLTILNHIRQVLPEYPYLYLGDNARAPYGTRSFDTIYEYTLQAVNYLHQQGCNLIILACNTASAKALRTIQQRNINPDELRVLGVIRPTVEAIPQCTQTKHVGVLATPGTVSSESYVIELQKQDPSLVITQQECPGKAGRIRREIHLDLLQYMMTQIGGIKFRRYFFIRNVLQFSPGSGSQEYAVGAINYGFVITTR